MKYPSEQFELLKKGLSILSNVYENIKDVHPCQLQYLLYQQASEGQRHNALYINEAGHIVKGYFASAFGMENYKLLIDFLTEDNFPLYPNGCNDTHVETAVKSALKSL